MVSKNTIDEAEILYSVCTEFFIERMNFRYLMTSKTQFKPEKFENFNQEMYFTHDREFMVPELLFLDS